MYGAGDHTKIFATGAYQVPIKSRNKYPLTVKNKMCKI